MEGNSRPIRFGVFEADLRTGELRKGGLRIKLTGQPFQVLAMLLERPGDVVTREELQKRLWPADTFVDFDHSLNTAINKIRESLGDSADTPRFVETLPRRGYRFVAPVDSVPSTSALEEPAALGAIRRPPLLLRGRWTLWMGLASAIVALATLAFLLSRSSSLPKVLPYGQITNDGRAKGGPAMTDGSRLYFLEDAAGRQSLVQVSAAGGETVPVPTPFRNIALFDISPNRSELLVGSFEATEAEYALWILPVLGGSPRRVADIRAHGGTWSPDGKRIAYVNGHDLYLAKSDGTEARKLVAVGGELSWPRWSPDGTVLRFSARDANVTSSSLWEVSVNGTNLHRLLAGWNSPPAECCGSWTPDGQYFVFQSSRNNVTNIWVVREKGALFQKASREPVQLTAGPMNFWAPFPSTDGKRLFAVGVQSRSELVRYDATTRQFVPYFSGISAYCLNFSRDGQWVAYVLVPELTLWRSKVDGSERLQLTFPPMRAYMPHWSPDGTRLSFFAYRAPGSSLKLYLVSPDGGVPQQLMPGERNESGGSWSADGNSLVFGGAPFLEGSHPSTKAIQILDLRTRRVSTLPGSEGLFGPQWSPDGRYIVAVPTDSKRLLIFDFATQKWTELARANVIFSNWSRDGKYVYFLNVFERDSPIYRVRISDHKLEQVASLKDFRRSLGRFGVWLGLAPDDSPLMQREIGSQEIYALDWQAP